MSDEGQRADVEHPPAVSYRTVPEAARSPTRFF
jgi:hypothetical protein